MAIAGSRTKATDTWLTPADEVLLGQRIAEVLPSSGWLCSHPGPVGLHQVHLHDSIESALGCGSTQAFLSLPAGASLSPAIIPAAGVRTPVGPPTAAVVQLLRSRLRTDERGEFFESGRLAVRWFEPEVGPEMHQTLTEQTRLIWAALRAVTRPAVIEAPDGRRTSGLRIGPAARDEVIRQQVPLARPGVQRLRLVT
ncbi:hypothetical protein [Streptomyces sp. NPDC056399]|uniref:hypothetical protein n=1 Tax=Streptomyces sp. NPDC056399 TaxID=3345807 RepID=UPI0035E2D65B